MSLFSKIVISIVLAAVIIITAAVYYGVTLYSTALNSVLVENNKAVLKEKIGQMLIVGFRGTNVESGSYIATTLRNLNIGGVILFDVDVPSKSFPRNIENPEQVKKLISDLQSHAKTPLFISVDAEGGKVNRLQEKYGFLGITSAEKMGSDAALETTTTVSSALAEQLHNLGFNMNFAPVVDVNVNPKNPVIGMLGRSFSSDPQEVFNHAKIVIQNHIKNDVIPVEKHFPGHGSSSQDSHLGLVDITKTYQQTELEPYIKLQQEGLLDAVMTAHVVNRAIDEKYPATLSSKFIEDILRNKIGFSGVVISDDMQMNAIIAEYGLEDAVVRAINAGCNILLLSNNGTTQYGENLPSNVVDIIYNAVQNGNISEEKIEASYNRIQNLKKKFNIL